MKRLILLISSAAIGAGAFAAPATAHDSAAYDPCAGHAYGSHALDVWVFGNDTPTVINVANIMYIDDRNFVQGSGLWIYYESNGQAGLQRGGTSTLMGEKDQCVTSLNPDTAIF